MTTRTRAFYLLKNRIKSGNRIMGIQPLLDFLKSDSTALIWTQIWIWRQKDCERAYIARMLTCFSQVLLIATLCETLQTMAMLTTNDCQRRSSQNQKYFRKELRKQHPAVCLSLSDMLWFIDYLDSCFQATFSESQLEMSCLWEVEMVDSSVL